MPKLWGSQRKVLQAISDLPKDAADSVMDTQIAQATHIAIKDVRDWLETLEEEGYVEVARTEAGLSASVTANGRQALGQFRPYSPSTPGSAPLPTTKPSLSPTGSSETPSLASTELPDAQPTAPRQAISADPKSPSAFISYSHDSEDHIGRVLELADALRDRGINVILDQYVHPEPEEGWPLWMGRNLDAAKFVLMICTETYLRRVLDKEVPGQGTGVRWEGKLIYNRICYDKPAGSRFIPILLHGSRPEHIPDPVRGHNHYVLTTFDLTDPGFEALYRHLTGQAPTPPPDLGTITTLPPRPRRGPSPDPR